MSLLHTLKAVRVAPALTVETLPAPAAITQLYHRQASLDPAWQDRRVDSDTRGRLSVTHSLSLGSAPMLSVGWHAKQEWYDRGYRVELYLNNIGFPPLSNLTPLEQLAHGRLVGEAHRDDTRTLALAEGSSFITLLLISKKPAGVLRRALATQRQKWTGSPVKVAAIVRFSADVPSLRLANDRIAQQTIYNESVLKNIGVRVQLASATGELDMKWYADRFEADVRRQTEELLATLRGTEGPFAEAKGRIEADTTLSTASKAYALSVVERLRVETLRLRQMPVAETATQLPDSVGSSTDATCVVEPEEP